MTEYGAFVEFPEWPEWLYLEANGKGQDPRQENAVGQFYHAGYWTVQGKYLFHKPEQYTELTVREFIFEENTPFRWKFLEVDFNMEVDPLIYIMENLL